jgi:hypothetical protein
MEGTNEYTRWEPTKLVSFNATSGSVGLEASYLVEPAGTDAARLTSRIEMQPSALLRLVEPLMAAGLRRDVDANLVVLKRLLEANTEDRSIRREEPD